MKAITYALKRTVTPLYSIFIAFIVGAIVILLQRENPFYVFYLLFEGAFIGRDNIALTFVFTAPLILTGLSVMIAHRTGLFNIGGEGQLLMGGVAAAYVGFMIQAPPGLHLLLCFLAACIVGGIWGGIAGIFKVKFGVHEVICTVMLNHIALFLTDYLVNYPLKAPGEVAQTPRVFASAQLPRILPGTILDIGIIFALLMCFVVYLFLWFTKHGYELRAVGLNSEAARTGGIKVLWNMALAMAVAGMLSGMAGAVHVLGYNQRFIGGPSPQYGFIGITIALLGKRHPVGIILAAILFGALRSGSLWIDVLTNIPRDFVSIIEAIIIILVVTEELTQRLSFPRLRNKIKHMILTKASESKKNA